jgi:hypothetical protein
MEKLPVFIHGLSVVQRGNFNARWKFYNSSFVDFVFGELFGSKVQKPDAFPSTSRVLFTKAENEDTQFPINTLDFVKIARSMIGPSMLCGLCRWWIVTCRKSSKLKYQSQIIGLSITENKPYFSIGKPKWFPQGARVKEITKVRYLQNIRCTVSM